MENKLTAVEFLADNLHYLHSTKWDDILIQAKEMEKQQIIDAYDDGKSDGYKTAREWDDIVIYSNAEQYYTQTFNK